MSTHTSPHRDRTFVARYGATILRGGIASIPSALYRYQGELKLTVPQVWFISAILSYKWGADLPYPSLKRMAVQSGVSERQLHNYKNQLIESGWLEIKNRHSPNGGQDTNYYDFSGLFARLEELLERDRESSGGSDPPAEPWGSGGLNHSSVGGLNHSSDEEEASVKEAVKEETTVNGKKRNGMEILKRLRDIEQPLEKADYIAESILTQLGDQHSEKFYRLVACKIPEQVIHTTLAEIKADGAESPPKVFTYRMTEYALSEAKKGLIRGFL